MKWISVKNKLPDPEKPVLVFVQNVYEGKLTRRLRAFYAPKYTIEQGACEDEYNGYEYNEEKDNYYLCEGWYENNEFDEVNWKIDGDVTHWMPLPEPPILQGDI